MEANALDPRLRLMQRADLKDRVVLIRVDHNVVKKGKIEDPYRIDTTFQTLFSVAEKGGRPVLMTHVGRPRDKKTGKIKCQEGESVKPIVGYLEQKLPLRIHVPQLPVDPDKGIAGIGESMRGAVEDLKARRIDMVYLPNTRWFQGEQSKGPEREAFARELSSLADLFINDAFGSWQADVSTFDVAKKLPSYAGHLLQKELLHLDRVLNPQRPFVAVIAGAKYDTKIGPLQALYQKADYLLLGGLMYNTFLAAKFGLEIGGVAEEDKALAAALVEMDRKDKKILELGSLEEADTLEGRVEGKHRPLSLSDLKGKKKAGFILDIRPEAFSDSKIREVMGAAKTIFVNAVMGLMPHYPEGSRALYELIASNRSALKLFGGGDTLQELRRLCPGVYLSGLDDPGVYYFTGGGSVLEAIAQGSPYKLKPVDALMS
ncbi:MAG: phosphoglycerate kinase [Thermodesulfobacteriota bacterium]